MKTLWVLGLLAGAALLGWRTGGSLDSDAMGMAAGILLGVGAAIPTAVILLAATSPRHDRAARRSRRADTRNGTHAGARRHTLHTSAPMNYSPQPPVIVLAGAGMQPAPHGQFSGGQYGGQFGHPQLGYGTAGAGGWPEPRPPRRFKVVGEQEAWLDE